MTFQELIKDPIFDLPIKQSGLEYFDLFLDKLLNAYLSKVDMLDNGDLNIHQLGISGVFVKEVQKKFVAGLLRSVREYLNGSPSKAYESLDSVLRNELKDFYTIMSKSQYAPNNSFYRIRNSNGDNNYIYKPKEMFHVPFPLRGKVNTQRFSIPGFPSLYISRSLYVCWEELNRPDIDKFQAVRLINTKNLTLLDLSPPPSNNDDDRVKYWYFMTWPLIACCSIKVKNYSDTFKPEYIISQLLLQWVRDNDEIDGIRYKSNHLDPDLFKQEGELYNIVLPVKEISNDEHCNKLKNSFEITEIISWPLHQFALGGGIFIHRKNDPIDKKLPNLELIKGRKYPYSYSSLGKLEWHLDSMPTFPIGNI